MQFSPVKQGCTFNPIKCLSIKRGVPCQDSMQLYSTKTSWCFSFFLFLFLSISPLGHFWLRHASLIFSLFMFCIDICRCIPTLLHAVLSCISHDYSNSNTPQLWMHYSLMKVTVVLLIHLIYLWLTWLVFWAKLSWGRVTVRVNSGWQSVCVYLPAITLRWSQQGSLHPLPSYSIQ